jgi:poly-D-alanine transfer protein DltD
VRKFPVGIVAFVLAVTTTIVLLSFGQASAISMAENYLNVVADKPLPIKWLTLTFQRAAYLQGHYLPIYGSSELYCCGEPYYPQQLFAYQPTGFDAFPVGNVGSGDLHNLQMFAALGDTLRGRKLVLSESPPYFQDRRGLTPSYYAGNFSPELADAFVFSTVSLDIREGGARHMRDYPQTLEGRPVLRLAIDALADPSPLHLAEYFALYPLGRLESWVLQLQDAWSTEQFIEQHPSLGLYVPEIAPTSDWLGLLRRATQDAANRSLPDPFGFHGGEYFRDIQEQPALVNGALRNYCVGLDNRNGDQLPLPTTWKDNLVASAEWSDLDLEMRTLEELGAQPLVWSVPLPGTFDNYTPISEPARQLYYQTFAAQMTRHQSVPTIDLSSHDEDRYFLTDISAHFSTRGWVIMDRALDMYWHDQPIPSIQTTIDSLARDVPVPPAPPPSEAYCSPPELYGI